MSAALLFIPFLILIIIGVPIAFSIGLSGSLFLAITQMRPLILVAQRLTVGMDSFALLAIPLFTLAGYLMEEGGLSKRLVNWAQAMFGWFPGSMGTITVICCAIFAALTGSGPATVAAIGAIMFPAMINSGYSKKTAAGILAAGGVLGPIIPPSISMIVYGSTMNVPVPDMFLAGIIPGVLIATAFILVNTVQAVKNKIKRNETRYTLKERIILTWKALGVLLLPVIILGGIYGGVFTPTEAAAIAVIYSIILGFIYKELTISKLISGMKKTIETSAMVVFIVGISNLLGWILAAAKIPVMIANAVIPMFANKYIYMLVLMFLLLVVGCLMEILAAILVLAPILVPIGIQMGWDPLHLGVIFCTNLIIGYITPPFGVNLFTASSTTGVPFAELIKGVLPYLVVAISMVLLLAFVPDIILFLPRIVSSR
ncbi:TRAP transporter large permease [Sedimentibacter sp.]|uniref:TRAP transporter large permease n=1 Tax=Sedimentibacter sp. TaxID=1960295 RepID=UPI0028966766|nr:TRAP transporter large permease [Sedimentibacter sp.]